MIRTWTWVSATSATTATIVSSDEYFAALPMRLRITCST